MHLLPAFLVLWEIIVFCGQLINEPAHLDFPSGTPIDIITIIVTKLSAINIQRLVI